MVYGYGKLLQIFHIIAMLLGIFMEKISRVPAAGRNWTRSCGAYASVRKGAGTCNKYWDKKQLKITQQNEPEIRSVKKKKTQDPGLAGFCVSRKTEIQGSMRNL